MHTFSYKVGNNMYHILESKLSDAVSWANKMAAQLFTNMYTCSTVS